MEYSDTPKILRYSEIRDKPLGSLSDWEFRYVVYSILNAKVVE